MRRNKARERRNFERRWRRIMRAAHVGGNGEVYLDCLRAWAACHLTLIVEHGARRRGDPNQTDLLDVL